MEYYAVILLGYILVGMIGLAEKKRYRSVVAVGINVAIYMPFIGRALGWW